MPGTDGAGSVQALRMRIARLAADGTTPAGASGMYVTDTIVKLDIKPAYVSGDDVEEKNGSGGLCLSWQEQDVLKNLGLTLTICSMDEELSEILGGGSVLTSAGSTIGYQMPGVGQKAMPNGISIEFWTRAIINGAPAATNPYRWWALPRAYLKRADASYDSKGHLPVFDGFAIENPLWGNGPNNDWLLDSSKVLQRQRVAAIPASAIGYQATPAQV